MFNNENIVLKQPSYKLIVVNNTNRDINIYIYNMTTPKMIESVNNAFIEPIIRRCVDNILFCSDGGIAATFFTVGAIKQLISTASYNFPWASLWYCRANTHTTWLAMTC